MTAFDRFDRRFGDALDDLASPHVPEYFEDVLSTAMRQSQRPAWTFLERWIPVSTLTRRSVLVPGVPWRTVAILLALLALLVAGAVISLGLRSDRTPAPPFGLAANGLISYVSDGDVYSRDLVTGAEELLVGGSATDVFPVFSRDGLSLAWFRVTSDGGDFATLMVANADGTDARSLGEAAIYDWMSWSPTSDALAVIAAVDAERTLSIVPIARGEEARAIDLPVEPEGGVVWRPPAGDELIFGGSDGVRHAIYGVSPDGTDFRQISADGRSDSYGGPYDITPDGSRMVFTEGGDIVEVGVLDLGTGDQRIFGAELPAPPEYSGGLQHHGHPSISPDGTTILFGRYWNELGGTINHQLYTASIDGDGADAVALGPVHRSQSGHNPFWQAYSPDGEVIIVVENDTFLAWTVHPDGTARDELDWRELGDPPTWQRVAP